MKKFTSLKNYISYIVIGLVTVICVILSLSGVLKASTAILLEEIAIKIMLAVSLSLVVGFLGELSLGHAGFMCVGAYLGGKVAYVLTQQLGEDDPILNIVILVIALVVGGICAGICGFLIGLPALRLRGDYLAITTLAFGEIVRTIFLNTSEESFGGPIGLPTPRFNKEWFYVICFIMVLITLFVIQNLIRSKHGRAIKAIRDNEIAARATGINVTRYKLIGFILSAVFAGLAGVLYSYTKFNVSSQIFDYNYSIEILVIVVLGGMGNIGGSIISAVLVTFLNRELANILTGNLAVLKDIIYAVILIGIVIYRNAPGLKNFREKYNLKKLFSKKKKTAEVTSDTVAKEEN
ncbi:MAG: branched-chain amino acid ABC transporter permease [Clostridia bacterium]|nr:branched-chain amino acid ABC transporter permease [Clostridia bacterium]